MECGDSIQHVVFINNKPQVPMVGTHSGKQKIQETMALVGPMGLEESLWISNYRTNIPIIVSRIHSHSDIGN